MLATLRNDFFCSIFPFYNVTELAFEWPERLGPRGFLLSLLRFFFNLCKRFISRSTQLRVLGIKVSLLEDGLDHFQR